MKFEISTANSWYHESEHGDLKKLGFSFRKGNAPFRMISEGKDISNEYSYIQGNPEVEITSLEELMNIVKTFGRIVLDKDSILIYDDYIE